METAAELAQLRTVCRNWDDPAAKAMFGRKIFIKSELGAIKLYRHLFRDPPKIPLIRHLDFNLDTTELPIIVEELLHLAFKPNIRWLTGTVKAEKFFTTVFDIVDNSPQEFDKLEKMPELDGQTVAIAAKRLILIKNFTSCIKMSISRTSEKLDQFPILTGLTIAGHANGLQAIENVLKHCPHLLEVNFEDFQWDDPNNTRVMLKEEVDAWVSANVKKDTVMETIVINSTCRPELVEYMTSKYTNIEQIEIDGQLWMPSHNLSLSNGNLERILNAISKVQVKQIRLILPASTKMKDAVKISKSRSENIEFDLEDIDGTEELILKLN
ncbi:hypothetical protein MBANPS3_010577 [Mucor bainieri]